MTTGTHTTPIQRYIDDMTFTFTQEADYCSVDVRTQLQGDHGGLREDFVDFNLGVLSLCQFCPNAHQPNQSQSVNRQTVQCNNKTYISSEHQGHPVSLL